MQHLPCDPPMGAFWPRQLLGHLIASTTRAMTYDCMALADAVDKARSVSSANNPFSSIHTKL